jgi:hypothetical protein
MDFDNDEHFEGTHRRQMNGKRPLAGKLGAEACRIKQVWDNIVVPPLNWKQPEEQQCQT